MNNEQTRLGFSPYEKLIIKAAHLTVKQLSRAYPDSMFGTQTNNVKNNDELEVRVHWMQGKSYREISPSIATVKQNKVIVGWGDKKTEIDSFFLIELHKQVPPNSIKENFSNKRR